MPPSRLGHAAVEQARTRTLPSVCCRVRTRWHDLGTLAGQHHERLDRSGYPHGRAAGELSASARMLAAADAYCAMTERRPRQPAMTPEMAANGLRAEVRAGRLDGAAVDAVLIAAGHRVRRRREWPAGLSPREVEVLRLLARGLSNRDVARRLVISEPTVAAHARHIYNKIGVTTRAAATLFAMQNALFDTSSVAEK
jgi:DNA-binding CsgD family transcriptional regulator